MSPTAPPHNDLAILFVCHANLCRSPLAEGVFQHLAAARGMATSMRIDSAGTSALEGSAPHPLSVEACRARGIALEGAGRQLVRTDLSDFDHIILMDRDNRARLRRMAPPSAFGPLEGYRARIRLLREISTPDAQGEALDVPDPIGYGPNGYEIVFNLVLEGCNALLDEIEALNIREPS